jgi:hypothetical protein
MNDDIIGNQSLNRTWRVFCFIGAVGALLQTLLVIGMIITMPMTTADSSDLATPTDEILVKLSEGHVWEVITMDLFSIGLIVPYLITTYACYPRLKSVNQPLLVFFDDMHIHGHRDLHFQQLQPLFP